MTVAMMALPIQLDEASRIPRSMGRKSLFLRVGIWEAHALHL
jgi:hypothetical protein